MATCNVCSKPLNLNNPHFVITIMQAEGEGESRRVGSSQDVAMVCEECYQEGLGYIFLNLKHRHGADTRLLEKMETIKKSVSLVNLLKEFGITGEAAGTSNLFLGRCPFHQQEASFLFDDREYYCFCEGLRGDIFSFIMNYYRDVQRQDMTLKKAVDYLLSKVPS